MKIFLLTIWIYSFPHAPSDELLRAISQVESGGNAAAHNESEDAAGLYQIRPIYVADVNRILGREEYTLADRFNPERANEMVKIYLTHYGKGLTVLDMARIHNGGPKGYKKACTLGYRDKIIKALLEQ